MYYLKTEMDLHEILNTDFIKVPLDGKMFCSVCPGCGKEAEFDRDSYYEDDFYRYSEEGVYCDACAKKLPRPTLGVNLLSWEPNEAEKLPVIQELWGDYSKMTGTGCSDKGTKALLDDLMEFPLSARKVAVQAQFLRIWGEMEANMDETDPDRGDLYRRVLGLAGELKEASV